MRDFSKAIGTAIPWYRREQYADILRIMADSDLLPATFDQWQARAEQAVALIQREGGTPVFVEIDATTFPAWCRIRGLNIDAEARHLFVADTSNWPTSGHH